MDYQEKQISADYKYHGAVVSLRVDQAQLPDGQIVQREVVEHHGGVGIALEDEDGKFFVVTQWRYAQNMTTLEFPAGKREPGEDDLTTASREIIEETGYEGTDFKYLGYIIPTGAYDSEQIGMYYAKKGKFCGQYLDSDEFLNISRMSLEELTEGIVAGRIPDAKTIAMTFLIKEMKGKNRK
ncbi:MAG: NUDIX hydrolase [Erysipelotrichia bacterium]|nr:NUDIX hydrolase [Erysipelotrichia bacterium]